MSIDRRSFLQLLSSSALAASFPASIARALAIPANNRTGTIEDVEHVVIMMQENRSFDHYFGTLRGVRGFGDPRAVTLPNGSSVFAQPVGPVSLLPFHPGAPNLGLQFIQDLAHDWTSTHGAWNEGRYDQWVPQKGTTTMAHLERADIPYHYALADAFTICDAYHCSLLGPTDPNRYYMWTGWVGNDGAGGGPVVDNAEAGYSWKTYPERLQAAGVSWKIYQDIGLGLNAAGSWGDTSDAYMGNYGDNSLLYFDQYRNAAAGSALYQGAKTGTNVAVSGGLFDEFKQDVMGGKLPSVSWVVAPEAYTEHPNWPANYGAWYVSQVLDALTANPEVWSKTVFLVTYDENDGFFDHVVPPTVPLSSSLGLSTVETTNEIFPGSSEYASGPYGMGVRVPMIVISPWSKGGYVNSQVMDHTSMIRLIERRFGKGSAALQEPNITPWRRAVSGDLTSAFNFATPNDATVPLPSTVAYQPPDNERHPDYIPVPPVVQALPAQEKGTRPAKALPYRLEVSGAVDGSELALRFVNSGRAAAVFQVRSAGSLTAPWSYTVGAKAEVSDKLGFAVAEPGKYDFSVYGPNGFLRTFKGNIATGNGLEISAGFDAGRGTATLSIRNRGNAAASVTIVNGYTKETIAQSLKAGGELEKSWSLERWFGWYDLTVSTAGFERQFAGHVEDGKDSRTDPLIGG
jgi:phospholipase C